MAKNEISIHQCYQCISAVGEICSGIRQYRRSLLNISKLQS